jgi:hypothetical protein
MNKPILRKIIVLVAMIGLLGCADPAFQSYVNERRATIAAMPNGPAKYYAEEQLAQQILADKRRQQQQAEGVVMAGLAGLAAGAAAPYYPYYDYRIGAICADGWQSSATSSGACSWHGGVMCWLYSDGTCH